MGAAIRVVALVPLIGIPEMIELYRQRSAEFAIAATTFAGVLGLGALVLEFSSNREAVAAYRTWRGEADAG